MRLVKIISSYVLVHKIECQARQDKKDFQIALKSIFEEKVYLWANDITFWVHLFMGRPMLIFSKRVFSSLTTSIFMTQILHWLCWLKTIHKKQSLVSTLTTLIYMEIHFHQWLHWVPHIKVKTTWKQIHHWIHWLRWLT